MHLSTSWWEIHNEHSTSSIKISMSVVSHSRITSKKGTPNSPAPSLKVFLSEASLKTSVKITITQQEQTSIHPLLIRSELQQKAKNRTKDCFEFNSSWRKHLKLNSELITKEISRKWSILVKSRENTIILFHLYSLCRLWGRNPFSQRTPLLPNAAKSRKRRDFKDEF